jgi:light-regulated signal transduction histidine kinase (bacteriophytochrome)
VRTKGGELIPVLVTSFLLTDDEGRPAAIADIIKDVTELKKTTTLLERRNSELKYFTSALSHDLAAPVRGIQSLAEDLQERCREFPDPEARENIRLILDSAKRMETLIFDLLSFARLDSQPFARQSVSCPTVLEQALANLRAEIKQSGAQVTSDALPTVSGNATQLTQLFQNLIGNAIKFCRLEAPRVHVSATRLEAGWEFAIRDNGIGMDAADLEKIFKPFQRLHAQEVFPGTGIGLAICRTIVERHGGRIWVESEKGRGSAFRFLLPEATTASSDEVHNDVPGSGP